MNTATITDFEVALKQVENASTSSDLFKGDDSERQAIYRKLALLVHPDRVPKALKSRAEAAFNKLCKFYNNKFTNSFDAVKFGDYVLINALERGDIANIYVAANDIPTDQIVIKVVREKADNDLIKIEAEALKTLGNVSNIVYNGYFPKLINSITVNKSQANVMFRVEGAYNLSLLMSHFPRGLDFRHAVWMMNRALSALGYARSVGYVHGGIIPEHLLYTPHNHGLVIVGWCTSVKSGSNRHIPMLVSSRENMYPHEVREKVVTPATDIYMLAKCIYQSFSPIPGRFRPFFDYCLAESWRSRPDDAWLLQDKWQVLARQEYGMPKFLELKLPVQ